MRWWPIMVLVAAVCVFCWPVFVGRVMLPADMCLLMLPWRALRHEFPGFVRPHNPMLDPIQQYLPWRIYAVESVRAGLVPLWNPYAFCGTPFVANLQSAVLYPPNVLFLIVGARGGFGVSAILHLCLGGACMYALLVALGTRPLAALLGGVVLVFNGYVVSWLEFPTLSLWVFMWLPAALLCYERARCNPRSLWPVLCAGVIAMQLLGGHFQIAAYAVLTLGLYALTRAVGTKGLPGRAGAVGMAAAAVAVGVALAAVQILPTLELARHTGRASPGLAEAVRTAVPVGHFVLYLVPNFFGNPVHYNYWGNVRDPSAFNFFETACYVGVLPLLLAAWSARRWREAAFWFFAALTVFAWLAALGSPVYAALYHVAPGFRELAGLGRVLCLAAFGLAGLAALGLDDLLGREGPAPTGTAWWAAGILTAVVAAAVILRWAEIRAVQEAGFPGFVRYLGIQISVFLVLAMLSAALVGLRARLGLRAASAGVLAVGLVLLDLFGFGIGFNPFVDPRMAYPETDGLRWLAEHAGHDRVTSLAANGLDWMPHNSPMVFGLRDIHGSDSLRVRRSFELVAGPALDQARYPPADSPLLDVLAVRYLMTRQEVPTTWLVRYQGEVTIYENTQAMPRAYVALDTPPVNDEEARRLLETDARAVAGRALVAPDPWRAEWYPRARPARPVRHAVHFERDDPGAIVLRVSTEAPGMLVLMDSYYPGWRAWVNGEPALIRRVNYGFRGVPVPAGESLVEMRYEPASYRVGLFISLVAAAGLSGLGGALVLARRARASATEARP